MAHTTPSPPKKFDKDTMVAEARRALSLDDTSAEDRRAAIRYLLQNNVLPQRTLVEEILRYVCGAYSQDIQTFKLVMELLCDRMPDWLKVGAYVLDKHSSRHGALRRVLDVNSVFVKLSEVLAIRDADGKYRQAPRIEEEKPLAVIWSGVANGYDLVANPQIIPASFAEMVRENEKLTSTLVSGVSMGFGPLEGVRLTGIEIPPSGGFVLRGTAESWK